jgi:serine/threonine protein kinase
VSNEFKVQQVLDEENSDGIGGTALIHGIGEVDGIEACIKVPDLGYSYLYRRELELLVGVDNIPDDEDYFDLPLKSLLREGIPANYKELFGSEANNTTLRMGLRFLREGLIMKYLFDSSGSYSSIPRILRLRVLRPNLGDRFYICPIMEVIGKFDYNFRNYITEQLQTNPSLSNKIRILKLLKPIASDLTNAHLSNVIYRDLKLDNIFIDDKRQKAYLGDWGLSLVNNDTLDDSNNFFTPGFTAPEILSSSANATPKTDLYSFGLILACVVLGKSYTDHQREGENLMTYIERHLDPYSPAITVINFEQLANELEITVDQAKAVVLKLRKVTKFSKEDRPDTSVSEVLNDIIIQLESYVS